MDLIRKHLVASIKASDVSADGKLGPVVVLASTGDEDRDGDSIDPAGWDLEEYSANPVILWAHDSRSLPIGTAEKIKASKSGLKMEIRFASHPFAKDVEQAVREGVVRGVSVGFRPTTQPKLKPSGGVDFKGTKLLEVSFVPVPANASALVQAKGLGLELCEPVQKAAEIVSGANQPPTAAIETEQKMPESTTAAPAPVAPAAPAVDVKAIVADAVAEAVKAIASKPVTDNAREIRGAPHVAKFVQRKYDRAQVAATDHAKGMGLGLGEIAIATAVARKNNMQVVDACEWLGYKDAADAITKTLGIGTIAAGGAFVPVEYSSEVIPLLRAKSVMRAAGVRQIQCSRDSFAVPKHTGAGTGYWIGESAEITESAQTVGQVVFNMHKLAALTVISKELLADAAVGMEAWVRDDLVRVAALKEDLAFFEGTGSSSSPAGIATLANSANYVQITGGGTYTIATANTDLNAIMYMLENADVSTDPSECFFVMHPRSRNWLRSLVNATTSMPAFPDLRGPNPNIWGYPVFCTSQISTTSTASRVYIINKNEVCIADRQGMELELGDSYEVSSTCHSAFAHDEVVVKLTKRLDFQMLHDKGAAFLHTVAWA